MQRRVKYLAAVGYGVSVGLTVGWNVGSCEGVIGGEGTRVGDEGWNGNDEGT